MVNRSPLRTVKSFTKSSNLFTNHYKTNLLLEMNIFIRGPAAKRKKQLGRPKLKTKPVNEASKCSTKCSITIAKKRNTSHQRFTPDQQMGIWDARTIRLSLKGCHKCSSLYFKTCDELSLHGTSCKIYFPSNGRHSLRIYLGLSQHPGFGMNKLFTQRQQY